MQYALLVLGVLLGGVACTGVVAQTKKEEAAAETAARRWLAIVDKGDYVMGWNHAAAILKGAIKAEAFEASLKGVRAPLGKVLSRKIKSKTFTTSAPGAPDGQYVIIQYASSFEHKKDAVETITPMLDADGTWRVAGYYIK